MKLHYLLLLFLLLPFSIYADEEEYGDIAGLESKAYKDIERYLAFLKTKNGTDRCELIFQKFEEKYLEFSTHMYKQYREYLNNFLTKYTADKQVVKDFQSLAKELQDAKGAELIKNYAENKSPEGEEALMKHLIARFKGNKILTVGQDCEIKLKKGQKIEMINAYLIGREAKLNTDNVCRSLGHKEASYPNYQNTVRFQLKDGKVWMWYCTQLFNATKEKLYNTKASCFAYDLHNNKNLLGDQRQTHIYDGEKPFEIVDGRILLAKSQGYAPLTYTEFLRKNQDNLPVEPMSFFQKVPKECFNHPKMGVYENKARLSLRNAEKVATDIEY